MHIHRQPGTWDGAFHRVRRADYEICFLPNADEPLDAVCNIDMWLTRNDGERWSGMIITLDEVARLMDRWQTTGEWVWDGLIVRTPGIADMVEVIDHLVQSGEYTSTLRHLGPSAP